MRDRLWRRIVDRKGFTWLHIPGLFLWLVSLVYRALFAISRRMAPQPVELSVPVISVGNITVGGSGKTPMTGFIARSLLGEGIRVGIASSAYGRQTIVSFTEPGYKVQKRPVEETSDEVMLLANDVPHAMISVDEKKVEAARRLAESGEVDVIIVDDGFQHWALKPSLNLVTFDAGVKRRWLRLFPNGVLREPLQAIRRADVVVITRANFARDIQRLRNRLQKIHPGADFYHANFFASQLTLNDQQLAIKYLRDKSVYLFAGVGNFRSLHKQVTALSGDVEHYLELDDHQIYDQSLLERIKSEADEHDPDLLLTTAKDFVKLGGFNFGRELCYLDLSIDLDPGEEKFVQDIMTRLNLVRKD